MNYIRHLNAFFLFVRSDNRLACSHVSLYLALFQNWNSNRFQNPFPVYRDTLMKQSKIGSKNTYHKCIRELHDSKYIYYHPSPSRFLPVKISISRLDIQEEPVSRYKQLDLFGEQSSRSPCPINDTNSVPILGLDSTENDTGTVPKMGHLIKLNFKENKTVYETPTEIFKKQDQEKQTDKPPRVPKSVHDDTKHPERSRRNERPTLSEVEACFKENNYPPEEANKFFLYNQGKGWMITDKLAIKDWKALVHKWMLNPKNVGTKKAPLSSDPNANIQSLYKAFLEGKNIFPKITENHFKELDLTLNEEIMQYAWHERINQLTGSNQNSILQLLQAYEEKKKNDPLLIADGDNLITLAKRIAVFKHFQQQNQ